MLTFFYIPGVIITIILLLSLENKYLPVHYDNVDKFISYMVIGLIAFTWPLMLLMAIVLGILALVVYGVAFCLKRFGVSL